MNSDDLRKGLLDELKVVEKLVRADLLAQYRADPKLMGRAMQRLREEESSPGDSAAWLETFAGRGAVLYILKTLYVRVLEDQNLLRPIRVRDGGTYETFRSLFPQLGHAAYLRRVFDDAERAVPELFAPTPVEIATPSGAAATAVWNVWQMPAPGGGPRFDFTGELDTRFIGDLYQDLDPDVKARYALLQTPRFVEEFILDRTLDPALAEFGLDNFRIIDPTCGSGHFLLGSFERLARAWRARLGDEPDARWSAAERALSSVYGADLNEYACAMSRFRLLLAIVKETGVTDLDRLRTFHINVISCDSLIPWERLAREMLPGTAGSWLARYGTDDERARNESFFARDFHAVVGNPPYILVKDKKKRSDYRLAFPRSASGKYSLSAPMTERFVLMPCSGGRSGIIVANNFCKRSFGKGVVEKVLRDVTLDRVIDSSGAYIPGHGTPTVMLFATNHKPDLATNETIVVAGKRGEPREPSDASQGLVWSSIASHDNEPGFEDTWIAVQRITQTSLVKHPWTLGSDEVMALKAKLDSFTRVADLGADAGPAVIIIEDEAFVRRYARALPLRPIVFGEDVRDWDVRPNYCVLSPLGERSKVSAAAVIDLWALRTTLWARPTFGGQTYRDRPNEKAWWQFHQVVTSRAAASSSRIVIGEVATNSQFVYDASDAIFTRTSPVVTIRNADEARYREVAAILNSSTLEFWFKQVCFDKGNGGINGGIAAEEWEKFYVRNGTNVLRAPLPAQTTRANHEFAFSRRVITSCIESTLGELTLVSPSRMFTSALVLDSEIVLAGRRTNALREQLVGLQEELDWNVYGAFELLDEVPVNDLTLPIAIARGHRPFEIALARRVDRGEEESAWFSRHGLTETTELPESYVGSQRAILERRLDLIENDSTIGLLEQPVYKRRWNFEPWDKMLVAAAETWLLDAVEAILQDAPGALTLVEVVTILATTQKNLTIAAYAKTGNDIGLADTVTRLLTAESIPENVARLLTASGLGKLVGPKTAGLGDVGITPRAEPFSPGESVDWKRVWRLQEREDGGEAVMIAVPPPFVRTDYGHPNGWRIRGKFNIASERFIVYDELSPKRYAWGGRTIPERARLSAEAFDLRSRQAEAAEAQPASVQPTPESPARCGIQFPLWDKLDELRRLGDPSYGDVRELAMLCGRTCPCDVLEHWRAQARSTRARRAAAVMPVATAATRMPTDELDPSLLERLIEAIRRTGDTGAPAVTLEPLTAGDRKLLTRALETLRMSGTVEPTGRGRGVRYRLPANRLL